MSEYIAINLADNIQHIEIKRLDKMNALTDDMYQAMATALKKSNTNSEIKVNLISGEAGCFTAGNDLADFLSYAEKGVFGNGVIDFLTTLATLDKPLILAIDGPAIGIGTTMAFHADLVYASDNAKFATPFSDLGLTPEAASSYLMPKTMGHAKAYELLALGETYSANQALQAGFVNKVIPSDELKEHTSLIAKRLAQKPESSLSLTKQLLKPDREHILNVMENEVEIFSRQLQSKEAKAAFEAFLNKSK